MLVGRSIPSADFALPRDAGRRPALQAVPALFAVGHTRSRGATRRCAGQFSRWGRGELIPRFDGIPAWCAMMEPDLPSSMTSSWLT